jgi:Transposase DNA-binding/Transposase DDE domain
MDARNIAATFGETHFGAAQLGDKRRTKRLVQTVDAMIRHPDGTLPAKIDAPAALKAAYRLFDQPTVTHASVLAPEYRHTLQLIEQTEATVLIIHDWTELDYTGLLSLTDQLGRIGNGSRRGYLCANALAVVAPTRAVLGLVFQKLAKRPTVKKKESRRQRRDRGDRETRLWREASRQVPAPAAGRRQVEIADRGADVLEFLDFMHAQGKEYVVRSKHNRRICLEDGTTTKLHDYARSLPLLAQHTIEVGATAQRPARQARVAVAWGKITLLVPKQPRGETRRVPLTTWVIRVRETDAPAGVEPLEWILLTNVPVQTPADAWERIGWYEVRWVIEEYHKALKTGCGVEKLQLTTEDRLQPAIAVLSVVALHLLNLRDASRRADACTRPATEVVSATWIKMLSLWRYKEERPDLTVHDFFYALARLGGHQNRKHDHLPGWLVLWRGWMKLQSMVEAASLLDKENCG